MISRQIARERVQRGAAHLDVTRPGWFKEIKLGSLRLSHPCNCIVGQLSGLTTDDGQTSFSLAARKLFGYGNHDMVAVQNGVDLHYHELTTEMCITSDEKFRDRVYGPLQDAWVEEIAIRQLAHDYHEQQKLRQDEPVLA